MREASIPLLKRFSYFLFGVLFMCNNSFAEINKTDEQGVNALSASNITPTGFTCNWEAYEGAFYYHVEIAEDAEFINIVAQLGYDGTITATQVDFTEADPNTTYYYRVQPFILGEEFPYSNAVSVLTSSFDNPTALPATEISSMSFTCNWNEFSGADYYQIDISDNSNFDNIVGQYGYNGSVTSTSLIFSAEPNTNYYYRVKPIVEGFIFNYSNTVEVLTSPPAPQNVQVSQETLDGFTINWDQINGITDYRLSIYEGDPKNGIQVINNELITGLSYSAYGLKAGYEYVFEIHAENASGLSEAISDNAILKVNAPIINEALPIEHNGFTANWELVTGADYYEVEWATNANFDPIYIEGTNDRIYTNQLLIEDLIKNTNYFYRVRAYNVQGWSEYSAVQSVTTLAEASNYFSLSEATTSSFKVSNYEVSGVSQYQINVYQNNNISEGEKGDEFFFEVNNTEFTINSLNPGTEYAVRIASWNGTKYSAYSEVRYIYTVASPPVLEQSTNIEHTKDDEYSFDLYWSDVNLAEGYVIEISDNPTFDQNGYIREYGASGGSGAFGRTIRDAKAGTLYYCRIKVSQGVSSDWSETISVLMPPKRIDKIEVNNITPFSAEVNFSTYNSPSATNFRLKLSKSESNEYEYLYVTKNGDEYSVIVNDLEENTNYHVAIAGENSGGQGRFRSKNFKTWTTQPHIWGIGGNDDNYIMYWQATYNASEYLLDVAYDAEFTNFVNAEGVTYNDFSIAAEAVNAGHQQSYIFDFIQPVVTYYFRIRAKSDQGTSAYSNTSRLTGPPSPPTNVIYSNVTTDGFDLAWDFSPNADQYVVKIKDQNDNEVTGWSIKNSNGTAFSGEGNSVNISGLISGLTYEVKVLSYVSATNTYSYGYRGESNIITLKMNPPTNLTASFIDAYKFSFNWSPPSGAIAYELEVAKDDSFSNIILEETLGVEYNTKEVDELEPDTKYYVRMRAKNELYTSENSEVLQLRTASFPPQNLVVSAVGTNSFLASWDPLTFADGYLVDVATDKDFTNYVGNYEAFDLSTTQLQINSLEPNKQYFIRVRAYSEGGETGNSRIKQTLTLPVKPQALAAKKVTYSSFKANWLAIEGINIYEIQVASDEEFNNILNGYDNVGVSDNNLLVEPGEFNTDLFYRVRAVNATGFSNYSNVITVENLNRWILAPGANHSYREGEVVTLGFASEMPAVTLYLYNNGSLLKEIDQLTAATTSYNYTVDIPKGVGYTFRAVAADGEEARSEYAFAVIGEENYVRTTRVKKEGVLLETDLENLAVDEASISTEFYDGLGRLKQKVMQNYTPEQRDLVETYGYDAVGRRNKSYLPMPVEEAEGWFKSALIDPNNGDYTNDLLDRYAELPAVAQDEFLYSETTFEASPLNRPVAENAPGTAWAKDGNNRPVFTEYLINGDDEVLKFVIDGSSLSVVDYFAAGSFEKILITDEDGNQSATYTDAFGKTILKRNYLTTTEYADTYYVYDIRDNLAFVLPPELIKNLNTENGDIDANLLNNYGFYYQYDGRNRMVVKKVPGAEEVFMVYDDRDRLVLTQDGNQRINDQWLFTKYDVLNRPVMTGIFEMEEHRNSIQDFLKDYAKSTFKWSFTSGLSLEANKIERIEGQGWGEETAISTNYLEKNVDGEIAMKITSLAYNGSFGLSDNIEERHKNSIDYSFFIDDNEILRIYENGSYAGSVSYGNYEIGDVLTIRRIGDEINYYHNDKLLHTTTSANTQNLHAIVDIYKAGGSFEYLTNKETEGTDNKSFGYSNTAFPHITGGTTVLNTTYYDNYNFKNYVGLNTGMYDFQAEYVHGNAFEQTVQVTGQVTGGLTNILGTNEMLATVNYYDDRYRLIQSISDLSINKIATTSSVYDFSGKVLDETTHYRIKSIPIKWTNLNNVTLNDYTQGLVKNTYNSFNGGANSLNTLAAGEDGWVSVTIDKKRSQYAFGLNELNTTASYSDIDYGFYFFEEDKYKIIEQSGSDMNIYEAYNIGDEFRVERNDGNIYYYHNDQLVHESEEFSSSDLVIDVSIWKSGYELKTISASFGLDNNVKDELDLNIHYTYDHADRLMEVTHEVAEPVKWEGLVGYEIDKDGGLKQAGTSSYDNTNAYSTIPIKLESDGSYGVKIETLGRFLIGLNNDPTGTSYKDMDYALYVASNGQLYAYENGGRKTNAGLAYFEIGDRVAIIKKGNQIYYTHNGEVFYPSNKPVTTDLYADVTSYNVGDRIVDAQLSTTGPQLMVSNEYNELGQLIKKNLHEDDEQFTQSVDYRYNIRGWLTRINNADLSPDGTEQPDLFGMEMGYTDNLSLTGADAQYNGNIAGIKWASKRNILDDMADPIKRSAYGYNYDALNRIRNANFFEGANYDPNQKYQLEIPADGYDMNGNIMYLNRKDENGAAMDQLRYHYTGNQLDYVSDASSNEAGFKDGNTNSDDYAYDGNGNMMQDLNKGITAITYNHLNLPHKVTFDNGDYINYLYDAAGTKLRQEVFKNGTFEKATDYVGAMIFENDELQFVQTSEGRLVPRAVEHSNDFEYQYHLKDHLGNVRSTFAVREDDYNTSFETPTNDYFDNYDEIDIVANNMAKTGGSSNRIASFGETAQRVGITKTLLVSEGDVVNASIYGKYVDLQEGNEEVNALPFITALANMLSGGILGGENPMDVSGIQDGFVPAGALAASNETGPQAYFNYILLDKSFNYVDAGFKQLTTAAADNGTGSGSHELLQFEDMTIPHDGFLMFFVSNESEELTEVYFDDLMINHHKTELIQADDYYPFGLTFNSYKKVYDKKNFMNTFQDQEYEQETGWVKFKWRNHQPELGRFFNVDPLAEDYYYNSTYAFSENKVTAHIELEGLESYSINNGENSFESAYNSFSNWLSNLVNVTFNLSQTNFSNEEEVEDFENSMQQASTINQVSKVGQNFSSGDIQPYVTISYGKEATNVIDAVNGNGSITLSPSGVLLGGGVDYSTPSALPSLSVSGGITIGNSSNTEGYFGGTTGYNGIGVETSSTYSLRQQQIGIVISTAWIWSGVYTGISKEVYSFDK